MLIVLEGLDGAGKSTQVKLLRSYLESLRPDLKYIHFPRYDSPVWGGLISTFLKGGFGSIDAVHPRLVALLFAGDRAAAAAEIRKTLEEGGIVLLDRYVYSNIAYQCAKLSDRTEADLLRDWILRTEYEDFGIPRPDLNIYLDVPLGFVEANLKSSREGLDRGYLDGGSDIHEADIAFQRRVRDIYREQLAQDPDFLPVDCSDADGGMLPEKEIALRVRALVDSRLGSGI